MRKIAAYIRLELISPDRQSERITHTLISHLYAAKDSSPVSEGRGLMCCPLHQPRISGNGWDRTTDTLINSQEFLPLNYIPLVARPGIEPGAWGYEPHELTITLSRTVGSLRIELKLPRYQRGVLPLNYEPIKKALFLGRALPMFNLIWQLHGHPSDDLIAINGDVFACICHSVRKHNLTCSIQR